MLLMIGQKFILDPVGAARVSNITLGSVLALGAILRLGGQGRHELPASQGRLATIWPMPHPAGMNRADEIAADTHEKIADSADTLKDSAIEQEESADRRTVLAADRTMFAAERTYAAWIRTGLAAMASGVGARALMRDILPGWVARGTGTMLVLLGGFCFAASVWREIWPGAPPPRPDARRLPPALLISVSLFMILASLAAVIGIWSIRR